MKEILPLEYFYNYIKDMEINTNSESKRATKARIQRMGCRDASPKQAFQVHFKYLHEI